MNDLASPPDLSPEEHLDRLKEVINRWIEDRQNGLRGEPVAESVRLNSWGNATTDSHDLAVEASILAAFRVVVNQTLAAHGRL